MQRIFAETTEWKRMRAETIFCQQIAFFLLSR